MSNEKWVCHVIGPDDVIDCDNELEALRMANNTNKQITSIERTDNDPFVVALAKDANKEKV